MHLLVLNLRTRRELTCPQALKERIFHHSDRTPAQRRKRTATLDICKPAIEVRPRVIDKMPVGVQAKLRDRELVVEVDYANVITQCSKPPLE
jgi:hypothetical protein